MRKTRRDLLQSGPLAAAMTGIGLTPSSADGTRIDASHLVRIDPRPLFEVSPWLHMQFMEPLGVTDGSVEAAWDRDRDAWRQDFVDRARDLAPQVLRFGGLFSRYYR